MRHRGLRFVVAGTGRSGSAYAAQLFTAVGLPCAHEGYFRYWPAWFETGERRDEPFAALRSPYHRLREGVRRMFPPVVGDASWMAVPRLGRFRGLALLQVRHPVPVVNGFVGNRFFSDPEAHGHYSAYALRFFEPTGDAVEDALRWWVEWNSRAESSADITYRLEAFDPPVFAGILDRLGVPDAGRVAAQAIAVTPSDVNHARANRWQKASLSWADIPAGPTKTRAERMAMRFGYELDGVIDVARAGDHTGSTQG